MFVKLLLHFGWGLVHMDLVARVLAADILRVHEVDVLDQPGTLRELRRRYANIAIETGLPMAAQRKVADMAWRYVTQAQAQPQEAGNRKEFSFYG